MDERFLESQRRAPRPEFARSLLASLAAVEDEAPTRVARFALPTFAAAAAILVVIALFAAPSVRVSAQAMLDFFRVREFATVPISPARLQQFRDRKLDPAALLGGKPVMLRDPGPAQAFARLDDAAAAAGFAPERPTLLPRGLALDTVFVQGEVRSRVTVDTRPLRDLMEAFDVRDLAIPAGLDGSTVEVHVPPIVVQRFRNAGRLRAAFAQCPGPEVAFPAGVDMSRLGEIGLRLLGMPSADAKRLADAIDWRTTLLVPVVGNATTFQQVEVNGQHGLYLESPAGPRGAGGEHGAKSVVMWSRGDHAYAITGNLDRLSIMQMAESVR